MQINLDTTDPYHLVYRGQKGSLVNMDTGTNSILVGPDEGAMYSTNPECFTLGPLNSGYCTGDKDLWGIALTGKPQVAFMEGLQNWQPSPAQVQAQLNALGLAKDTSVNTPAYGPVSLTNAGLLSKATDVGALHAPGQTVANEISTTGAPALRLSGNLAHGSAQTVLGNTAASLLATTTVTQTSFQLFFSCHFPAGSGTIPFGTIILNWFDAALGSAIDQDTFYVGGANGAPDNEFYLSGPLRGDKLNIVLQNLDPLVTMTYTFSISQTSHPFTEMRFIQWVANSAPIGFNGAGGQVTAGVLLATAPLVGINTTVTRYILSSNAHCMISVDNSAGTNPITVVIGDPEPNANSLYGLTAGVRFYRAVLAAGASTPPTDHFQMPNGPAQLSLINGAGAAVTPTVTITESRYHAT